MSIDGSRSDSQGRASAWSSSVERRGGSYIPSIVLESLRAFYPRQALLSRPFRFSKVHIPRRD